MFDKNKALEVGQKTMDQFASSMPEGLSPEAQERFMALASRCASHDMWRYAMSNME